MNKTSEKCYDCCMHIQLEITFIIYKNKNKHIILLQAMGNISITWYKYYDNPLRNNIIIILFKRI